MRLCSRHTTLNHSLDSNPPPHPLLDASPVIPDTFPAVFSANGSSALASVCRGATMPLGAAQTFPRQSCEVCEPACASQTVVREISGHLPRRPTSRRRHSRLANKASPGAQVLNHANASPEPYVCIMGSHRSLENAFRLHGRIRLHSLLLGIFFSCQSCERMVTNRRTDYVTLGKVC